MPQTGCAPKKLPASLSVACFSCGGSRLLLLAKCFRHNYHPLLDKHIEGLAVLSLDAACGLAPTSFRKCEHSGFPEKATDGTPGSQQCEGINGCLQRALRFVLLISSKAGRRQTLPIRTMSLQYFRTVIKATRTRNFSGTSVAKGGAVCAS